MLGIYHGCYHGYGQQSGHSQVHIVEVAEVGSAQDPKEDTITHHQIDKVYKCNISGTSAHPDNVQHIVKYAAAVVNPTITLDAAIQDNSHLLQGTVLP